ncbi:GyrI-like domain-containing protein [Paenibacillus soyae]|uniref:GyrI-like domain-containing protein n=1 Tax=Paenibacillus soyae TaxID=2969249 RepID=A0A9X2SBX6_9BACL|nr:GyrI-like domain-containing protein [Paenibacillus soyae]MCR2805417.1 GyrI-like domain-containing protein [Paenibacillus soyae]
MTNYSIQTISENYKMTAFGVTLEDYNDWAGNAAKTAAKKAEITENGKLAELLALADGQEYQLNYVLGGKAWRGFGVKGEFDLEGTIVLNFLAGDYIVVPGTGADQDRLADEITGKVFGGLLEQITDYKYVGPGNSTFVKAADNGEFYGEIWLRAKKVDG